MQGSFLNMGLQSLFKILSVRACPMHCKDLYETELLIVLQQKFPTKSKHQTNPFCFNALSDPCRVRDMPEVNSAS